MKKKIKDNHKSLIKTLIFSDLASETDVKKLKSLKSSEKEAKNYQNPCKKEVLRRTNKTFKQNDRFY